MRCRILFVDDNPLVLDGLCRQLRPMREQWEMSFARTGEAAMARLAAQPHQVIVTDRGMSMRDGSELSDAVTQRYPQILRVNLAGHADLDSILGRNGAFHPFLADPTGLDALKSALSKTAKLDSGIKESPLRELVSQIGQLPSLPRIYLELTQALKDPYLSPADMGTIIERDISMTARILKLVNSAFFGLGRTIVSPGDAVNYIGKETVKTLVLSLQIFAEFKAPMVSYLSMESLWKHSLEVATLAKKISKTMDPDLEVAEESFSAGMLHDVGRLILLSKLNSRYTRAIVSAEMNRITLLEAEQDEFNVTHAGIGGYLLGLWGLPLPIIEAVTWHHFPENTLSHGFTPTLAVHLADALIQEAPDYEGSLMKASLNLPYLESIGLAGHLEEWRRLLPQPEQA